MYSSLDPGHALEPALDSDREYFAIPNIGKVWPRGDNAAIALNFYGRGGMNSDWSGGTASLDPDGPGPAPVTSLHPA